MSNEADTCRKHVVPKLQAAGWDAGPHTIAGQRSVTDGRIVPVGKGFITCPSLLYATAREVIASLTARSVNGRFLLPSVSVSDQTLEPQDKAATDPKG